MNGSNGTRRPACRVYTKMAASHVNGRCRHPPRIPGRLHHHAGRHCDAAVHICDPAGAWFRGAGRGVVPLAVAKPSRSRPSAAASRAAIALPVVGLIAAGVGALLHHAPWFGALVFVAGMFTSIWLRRFGPMARRRRFAARIAFRRPVDDAIRSGKGGQPTTCGAGSRGHCTARAAVGGERPARAGAAHALFAAASARNPNLRQQRRGHRQRIPLRPIASTRMAIQMAVALTAAFVVGYVFFAERWAWVVLTAFIVISGNRGRLDVAYKSVLRVLGAAAGTLVAPCRSAFMPDLTMGRPSP